MTTPTVGPREVDDAVAALERGATAVPADTTHHFRLAGEAIALRARGTWGQFPIPDAFAHLPAVGDGAPGLTIDAWDSASTGITPEPLPPPGAYRLASRGVHLTVYADPPGAEAVDLVRGTAVAWCPDTRTLPDYQRYRPVTQILARWLPARGHAFLHAAAVGDDDGAVLLVGLGGAGKSTTSLACAERGIRLLGDDFTVVGAGSGDEADGDVRIASVYGSVKLRGDAARRMGLRDGTAASTADACTVLPPARLSAGAPARAIVAVTPAGTGPALRALPPEQVRAALMSTGLVSGIGGDTTLRPWLRAVHRLAMLPAFTLHLGWDLDAVVELVDRVRTAPVGAAP